MDNLDFEFEENFYKLGKWWCYISVLDDNVSFYISDDLDDIDDIKMFIKCLKVIG